jgi:hypothetical protein
MTEFERQEQFAMQLDRRRDLARFAEPPMRIWIADELVDPLSLQLKFDFDPPKLYPGRIVKPAEIAA